MAQIIGRGPRPGSIEENPRRDSGRDRGEKIVSSTASEVS